jgi:hypothetical protein
MKRLVTICIAFITAIMLLSAIGISRQNQFNNFKKGKDSLPNVLTENHADLLESKLRHEALLKYDVHQLPGNLHEWETYRARLRNEVIQKAGVITNHKLPLNTRETGSIKMKGYTIKNIAFQTRPGVYATANLYVPDGEGPFPAVIQMHGHWTDAKIDEVNVQPIGHSLALNGYVCLTIDAFGAGERSTIHGVPEYHGYGLGASLMNIGETLIGFQVSDNIRAVDLLSSLPYVDAKKIGATGASGGGNQTMWLTALDDRIKAAVPVVSVGTFESYVMRDNCICELLPDGLTFTEEAGILALVAPRAIKMCNHRKDDIPTFLPAEMLRSYNKARPIFKMMDVENNIAYQLLDSTHGYWKDDREAMLGWFDLHLKGIGTGKPKTEIPFEAVPSEKLMVYAAGKRDPNVLSIADYCKQKGNHLRSAFLNAKSYNAGVKKNELRVILRIGERSNLKSTHEYSNVNGWSRSILETSDGKLIPLLHLAPRDKSLGYVIICNPKGKSNIEAGIIEELKKRGSGIAIVDLSGTGETASPIADTLDGGKSFHTVSRAELWLGKTVMGEWVKELDVVAQFLKSSWQAQKVSVDGTKESGLAGLFLATLEGNVDAVTLRDAPVSYLFDNRETVDFFSMAVHLPRFLNWGDVSLAAALTGKDITFINPRTISGQKIDRTGLKEYQTEFERVRTLCKRPGKTLFQVGM